MADIGFIGLGNMGGPMAANLVAAGYQVAGFDVVPAALEAAVGQGVGAAESAAAAAPPVVITMLPAGRQVRGVYTDGNGIIAVAPEDALLIDRSTIDVATAREVHQAAVAAGQAGAATPLGAAALYREFVDSGHGELDYSALIQMIRMD